MSHINRLYSRLPVFSRPKSTANQKPGNYWSKYFNLRISLALLVIGGLSFAFIKSGAQELNSPDSVTIKKSKKHINFDLRMNGQANLAKVIERNAAGRDNVVADITDKAREQALNVNEAVNRFKVRNPTVEATISPLTGAVEVVRGAKPLTGVNPWRDARDIALDFIQENKQLYGLDDADIENLHYVGESVNQISGLRSVIFEQKVNDRLVFQGENKFAIDRDGRIVHSLGLFVPKATERAAPIENLISPQEALVKTMETVGIALDARMMTVGITEANNLSAKIMVADTQITGTVDSRIVYFPVAPGIVIPAWSQTIFSRDADYYALVDATDGTLLFRKQIRSDVSTHQARFRVYVQTDGVTPADNPAPLSPTTVTPGSGTQGTAIAPSIVNMLTAQNITASPNGWIDDCPGGADGCTQTIGNNTHTYMDAQAGANNNLPDTNASFVIDGAGKPTGNPDASVRNRDFLGAAPRDFQTNYLPPPQGGNPEAGQTASGAGNNGTLAIDQFRRGMLTQLFYTTNWYHDRLYALGFTPASRNFQQNNFGGGGLGADRVLGEAVDNSGVDNANFSTPADGVSGRMQMYVFSTGPTIDRDGSLDTEIVIHELTHGTSNRLVGNGSGLNWDVGGSMGEGWSDFYALSLLNNTNTDTPTGNYASGAYATYKAFGFVTFLDNYLYGIRRFPYSTVNTQNPLTWADVDDVTNNLSGGIAPSPLTFNNGGAMEVHNAGELWANSLWEVRQRIIADPAGANGDVPTGNQTSLAIVTDAMRSFTPNNPSFVEGRDALISADCAVSATCPNELSIWGGFADRGLGYNAIAPLGYVIGYVGGHMGVGESFEMPNLDVNTTSINDTVGGNSSGAIDPAETVRLTVNLRNPYRGTARDATGVTTTLTTTTPGVTISDNAAAYPNIAEQANSNPNAGDTFTFTVPAAAPCGSALRFTITTNSSLGTASKSFIMRVGAPSGTLAPVTYTRNPAPDIPIPDNAPRGVGDSLAITDDFEIADLNFRMDSLTHTFVQDVTVMLRAPNGYGTDLIGLMGDGGLGGANQDNMVNMVIDQTAAAPNDQRLITAASDPFTDDWLPIFNAPSWTAVGFPTDPVGQLTRFNGLSTLGTWNLRVSDQFDPDTGTLNQWSMIVTPRAFTCTPFSPSAAHVSVGGRVYDTSGRGIMRAVVTLVNQNGVSRTAMTNAFGYYRFDDVVAGQNYVVNAQSKLFTFLPQALNVNEDVSDLDFIATP